MHNYKKTLDWISERRKTCSLQDTRSAVLEARLALEAMAVDRLKASRKYISSKELNQWKPKGIIDFLVTEVDAKIATEFMMSVAPTPESSNPLTVDDYEKLDFKRLGNQSGLNVKKLGKLWHKASNFLHLELKGREDKDLISNMNRFLDDFEEFAKEVDSGNLIAVMTSATIRFTCSCGTDVQRNEEFLREGMIIGCPNPDCWESYTCEKQDDKYIFEDRGLSFSCPGCGESFWVPGERLGTLRGDQRLEWVCKCGKSGLIKNKPELLVCREDKQ